MKKVTAAIVIKDNKVLISRRGPNEPLAGKWEFPGGKVEEGESLEEGLARELFEELEIDVSVGKLLVSSVFKYEHGEFEIFALDTTILNGEPVLKVHDFLEYVGKDEILNYDLLPADIPIAKYLIENNIII